MFEAAQGQRHPRALGRLAVAFGDVPGDRVYDLLAQAVQPLGVSPLRRVLFPAA